MRIGIFGGTFDPVHYGHLLIAEQAREQAVLDQVWFVPSARPPHKLDKAISPFERRAEMLQLAIAGQTNFRVELIEKDRPGPSFTANTLDDLHRLYPDNDYGLILGADCLPDLAKWYEPLKVLELATLLVSGRPGWDVWTAAQVADSLGITDVAKARLQRIEIPLIEISSRDLRRRASAGRSLLYMMPRAVEVFIREKRLYEGNNDSPPPCPPPLRGEGRVGGESHPNISSRCHGNSS
jgi:nicotinate-nucleotide adenylyltransferase